MANFQSANIWLTVHQDDATNPKMFSLPFGSKGDVRLALDMASRVREYLCSSGLAFPVDFVM